MGLRRPGRNVQRRIVVGMDAPPTADTHKPRLCKPVGFIRYRCLHRILASSRAVSVMRYMVPVLSVHCPTLRSNPVMPVCAPDLTCVAGTAQVR